ncbi:MAG: pilin [Lachnospiraceae bacterium]|nr:pilin [Lachnospiraceae bacterium]
MKKLYVFLYIFLIIFLLFPTISEATYPKLVTTIKGAFDEIEKWILYISTPAAAVAVGTGIFMKKFSFGDEEKIRTGKRIIRGSLFSYAFILVIDLILNAIKAIVS